MNNDDYIRKFYQEVKDCLEGDYKIILEPQRDLVENWIEYDKVKWELEEKLEILVNNLLKDNGHTLEEKIIIIYEFICLNYIYDVNVLYFFKKDKSNPDEIKYIAVDWYGRIVGNEWIANRKKHNRRICYEFARFYAKAINMLIKNDEQLEAFLLGDKENLHYVVGVTGKDYSIIIDLDDFNHIKDLTRLKMGLNISGIKILRDPLRKFEEQLNKYNNDKFSEVPEIEEAKLKYKDKDLINYFNEVIKILNSYNIDSQGFFEYMRFIIEESNIDIEKIWKEDTTNEEKRYERCFYFELNKKNYLLDSIEKNLTIVDMKKIDKKLFIFNPEENYYSYYGG